jgi:ABC-type lipoprotein export system ATPase subunit
MISTFAPIIEIKGPRLASFGIERMTVRRSDVINVVSDAPAVSRRFLRMLATLDRKDGVDYRFQGSMVNLKNYQRCLDVKRRIGYVAADAAMISNRTLRENLLLARFYYENDLTIDIDEPVRSLCEDTGLAGKLDLRPSALSRGELLKAVAIREMAKGPAMMLIERPENFLEETQTDRLFNHLKRMIRSGTAVIYFTFGNTMKALANRQMTLAVAENRTRSV